MFCSGILLSIYHTGYFIADTSLLNFRWQNAKQWVGYCPASGFLSSWRICQCVMMRPSCHHHFSEVTPPWQNIHTLKIQGLAKSLPQIHWISQGSVWQVLLLISGAALFAHFFICLLALFMPFSTPFWLLCTQPLRLAIWRRRKPPPTAVAVSFPTFWNKNPTHLSLTSSITIWVATKYFSTIGPERWPNTRFHQWCLLAYSVKSNTS